MSVRRRVRRWRNHTPSQEIALVCVGLGAVLVLVAAVFVGFGAHWL